MAASRRRVMLLLEVNFSWGPDFPRKKMSLTSRYKPEDFSCCLRVIFDFEAMTFRENQNSNRIDSSELLGCWRSIRVALTRTKVNDNLCNISPCSLLEPFKSKHSNLKTKATKWHSYGHPHTLRTFKYRVHIVQLTYMVFLSKLYYIIDAFL